MRPSSSTISMWPRAIHKMRDSADRVDLDRLPRNAVALVHGLWWETDCRIRRDKTRQQPNQDDGCLFVDAGLGKGYGDGLVPSASGLHLIRDVVNKAEKPPQYGLRHEVWAIAHEFVSMAPQEIGEFFDVDRRDVVVKWVFRHKHENSADNGRCQLGL